MAAKLLALLLVAAALTQGQAQQFTEIRLEDVHHQPYITNPFLAKTITIPKMFTDTLLECVVVFPNGIGYQAYPNNQLPPGPISFLHAVQPFTSCAIGFLNVPVSAGGTYELQSLVRHGNDNSLSLTQQRHHLTFIESEVEFPFKTAAAAGDV